jgi:GntR family transcriptional repressor for pyruvate dehydrogenase complex
MSNNIDQLKFKKITRQPLYEQVADTIQEMISTHELGPGTRLPTERELAQQMDVNRTTVHQAVGLLQQRGLVEMKVGSGTYVIDMPPSVVADSIQRYFTFGNCSFQDLVTLRCILEPEMAALAARSATAKDLALLNQTIRKLEEAFERDDETAFAFFEMDFHEGIASATHNELIMAISKGMHNLVRDWLETHGTGKRTKELVLVHRAVCDAVTRGDPAGAREAMLAHMRLGATLQMRGEQVSCQSDSATSTEAEGTESGI